MWKRRGFGTLTEVARMVKTYSAMPHANRHPQLSVTVVASPEVVKADVSDGRQDTVSLFGGLDEAQHRQLALDAWSIGLRALANAHSQAQEVRLQDVGHALVEDVDRHL